MFKFLIFIIFMAYSQLALACPGCAGSTDNQKDNITVVILATFIVLCYLPMIWFYRVIKKYAKSPVTPESK
jgi:hypothetical protein